MDQTQNGMKHIPMQYEYRCRLYATLDVMHIWGIIRDHEHAKTGCKMSLKGELAWNLNGANKTNMW